MNKLSIVVLFMLGISGCSTINPERSIASDLVGQDVSEAVKRLAPYMGEPRYITPTGDPGYKLYEWLSNEGHYDRVQPAGTYTDTSQGYVQHVETYTTERKYTACRVSMTVNSKNIVEYYETKGCGFMGLGNTGSLHKWGIN